MNASSEKTSIIDPSKSSRKPIPDKGFSLKYPIDGGGVYCPTPVRLRYNLICGSNLELKDAEGLVNQFEFFLTQWLQREQGRQRVSAKKYRACIDMLLANLRYAHLEGKQLLAPTRRESTHTDNPAKIGYTAVNKTLELLEAKEYIKLVRGIASEFDGACTWCEPLSPLVAEFERRNIRAELHKQTALVEIRKRTNENTSRDYEILQIPHKLKPLARRLSAPAIAYNETWLNHMPTLDDRYIVPWCRRIFNDSFDYGGRFYGSFQQLPKLDRARLKIDGEPTLEPDYSAYHISILYAWCEAQLLVDPYKIEGYQRETVKAVMLPLLNSENLSNLAGQITKSSRRDIQLAHAEWDELSRSYHKLIAQGLRYQRKEKPAYLQGFIKGIPENTDGKALIDSIINKHSAIKHYFGTHRIGLRLQKQDSEIMGAALKTLSDQGIPALPVHDSLRCKITNLIPTVEAMKEAFLSKTGFTINVDIDREFNRKPNFFERMEKDRLID